jgi:1-deoxy-D-xylulose-5-phosphate reductoisomerase
MQRKRIVILGSTGSIGTNTVKIAEHLSDEIEVVGLVANNNIELLAEQAKKLNCKFAITSNESLLQTLRKNLPASCTAQTGLNAINELVSRDDVDLILAAIVGTTSLIPVLTAIKAKKQIALASKEVLVMAGKIVMAEAEKHGVNILPVDSEHSAIFQCIDGKKHSDISRLILTASGGAFRGKDYSFLKQATYKEALAHPTWDMGPKVTIDSATLMNKALEIIEAHWLFNIPGERIDVVIHPQAIIHSMVEFLDGTILAQMSSPDMKFPIQYAITYPHKKPGCLKPLDFAKYSNLTFEIPNNKDFPSLDFAYEALKYSDTMPAVMNAANEVAVSHFAQGNIGFTHIWETIEGVMKEHTPVKIDELTEIIEIDNWARIKAEEACLKITKRI